MTKDQLLQAIGPTLWGALSFLAGVASKSLIDSYLRRRDDTHKFLLDKRLKFIEQQLSQFYWPIYLHLQKDNLIWERLKERDQDPNSTASKLSLQIEAGVILPNHKDALAVIEKYLHLAGDDLVVDTALRYVRHVKIYEMLRDAGIKDDPVLHGEKYPSNFFPLIEGRVKSLQTEYDQLVFKIKPTQAR